MTDLALLDDVVRDQIALLCIACAIGRGDITDEMAKLAVNPHSSFVRAVRKNYAEGNRNRSPFLGPPKPKPVNTRRVGDGPW